MKTEEFVTKKFYYVRDKENRPAITVCLLAQNRPDGVFVARGIAVCSDTDNPCKIKGRGFAFSRANKAFVNGISGSPVGRGNIRQIIFNNFKDIVDPISPSKSECNPILSMRERKLLGIEG